MSSQSSFLKLKTVSLPKSKTPFVPFQRYLFSILYISMSRSVTEVSLQVNTTIKYSKVYSMVPRWSPSFGKVAESELQEKARIAHSRRCSSAVTLHRRQLRGMAADAASNLETGVWETHGGT